MLISSVFQVQEADEKTRSVAGSKLSVIAEQIRFLQKQAEAILEETKLNADLNHAACNMVKKPGTVYHLYERDTGQKYLSILSPKEWGASCPHKFHGSYRWESVEKEYKVAFGVIRLTLPIIIIFLLIPQAGVRYVLDSAWQEKRARLDRSSCY